MYDDSTPDTAKITVIATGLEEVASAGQGGAYTKKADKPGFSGASSSSFRSSSVSHAHPVQPSFAPRKDAPTGSTIQIPSFLQKK